MVSLRRCELPLDVLFRPWSSMVCLRLRGGRDEAKGESRKKLQGKMDGTAAAGTKRGAAAGCLGGIFGAMIWEVGVERARRKGFFCFDLGSWGSVVRPGVSGLGWAGLGALLDVAVLSRGAVVAWPSGPAAGW